MHVDESRTEHPACGVYSPSVGGAGDRSDLHNDAVLDQDVCDVWDGIFFSRDDGRLREQGERWNRHCDIDIDKDGNKIRPRLIRLATGGYVWRSTAKLL